jgi:F-type H+-transporting ATPase subunit b
MISLDWSIIPAIFIFITTIIILNFLLFRPILSVQAEREKRTTGLMWQTRKDLDHHLSLFDQYQATIKNARMEGYRLVEKSRAEALQYRNSRLEKGRGGAEQLTLEAREMIRSQVVEAKARLERDVQEIARQIASAILHRSA